MESLSMLADQEASQETLSHIQSIDAFNEVVEVERDASTSGTPSAVRSETAASSFLDVPSPSSYSVKRGIIIPTPTPSIGLFHRLTSPFRRANATADSNSPSMQPLTRQETHSSTLSWWSDKNPGLQPPSINLHAVAKPLMKLLYHRQAMAFIKRNHTSPLSSEIMATYSRYLRWTSVSSFTKAAILSELSNTCASPEDARTVVDSLRFWYLVEMLDSPAPRVRSSACRLLGSLASHGCTAPDIAELCRRLQSLLGDKDTKVVLGANYALSQIPRDKQDF
ncbi:hypothetical protein B0H19DRAFT_487893 [Mycena capillaripes]|nr:hypothetical protein B0H19DRAFT_487893 [Mycena capillaripes]